ncbi:MAG: glutaredoxin [Bdellovibrionaceae bacterium]|nr:glutaredoxin [Pseudobdellovibrionaceae bacterium]
MKTNAKVVIYTKDPCPFCVRAINFLTNRDITFTEVDLTGNQAEMDRMKSETGWATMPIILINDQLVGGYTDLVELENSNQLESMLKA